MRTRVLVTIALACLLAIPAVWAGSQGDPEIVDGGEEPCGDSEAADPITQAFTDVEKAWFNFNPAKSFAFGVHIFLCEGDVDPFDPDLQYLNWAESIGWEVSFEPLWEDKTWTVKVWTQLSGTDHPAAKWAVCSEGDELWDHNDNRGEIIVPTDNEDRSAPWMTVRLPISVIPRKVETRDTGIEMLNGLIEPRVRAGNYSINETATGHDATGVNAYKNCGAQMTVHDRAPDGDAVGDGFFQLPASGEENRFEQGFLEFATSTSRLRVSQGGSIEIPLEMSSQAKWTRNATFTADAPPTWDVSFEPSRLPVPAKGQDATLVNLTIPRHAETGDKTLTVNAAVSDLGKTIENITWTLPVSVREYPRSVSVTADQADQGVRPGKKVDYVVTIHNTGRLGDRYALGLEGGPGWRTQLATDNVTLAAGANAKVGIRVHVPADVTEMRDYTHQLVTTSTIDGVTSAEQVLTTGVLVPPDRPDDSLMSVLPSGADVPTSWLQIVAIGMVSVGVVVVAVLLLLALGIL